MPEGIAAQSNFPASKALIYSATADFRHDSIPTAVQSMKTQGPSYNVQFDQTEDMTWFTDDTLATYDALVFLDNTGEVLDADGQAALQRYIDKGGNFVAIHAASDCLRNSTFMEKELGAHFDYHPQIQNATIDVVGPSHPSTSMLPAQWPVFDEMYNFKSDPRAIGAVVILSANESSYVDPGPRNFDQGTPHPTAWYQEHGAGTETGGTAGRSWYTSLGHTNETWQDSLYLAHVMNGITWAIQSGTTKATNASALVGFASANTTASSSAGSQPATGGAPGSTSTSATSSSPAAQTSTSAGTRSAASSLSLSLVLSLWAIFLYAL
ncbi:class I glutamine amidotransferase-like protein [Phanerochaete sordida]|uniref:Class I glutamine amidotransferase-like protein n=1 Tax=Phanerochaete sordida TaxID=48140 RepID=A0A9P3GMN0_9APHY|nr:class I glutamine amidotransferase-like protein [Phanerochaete sordida]